MLQVLLENRENRQHDNQKRKGNKVKDNHSAVKPGEHESQSPVPFDKSIQLACDQEGL